MSEAFRRLLQAVRLQRDAYVWMDFNDRATGDALIFVAITTVLLLLGAGESLLGLTLSASGIQLLISALISNAVFWLAYSGLSYAIARFFLQAGGTFALYLRIAGFAYPTLLLTIFTVRLVSGFIAFLLGAVWFLAVMAYGVRYASDLSNERSFLVAGGGLVAWVIVSSIFGGGIF